MSFNNKLQTVGVLGSITAVVLLARVFFITAVGNHWLGTFGITSGILVTLTMLAWRDKIGAFGQVYKKVLLHRVTQKLTFERIVFGVFVIMLTLSFSTGMHTALSTDYVLVQQLTENIRENNQEITTVEGIAQQTEKRITENPFEFAVDILKTLFLIFLLPLINWQYWVAVCGAIVTFFPWLLHLIDITLVEEIEIFGLLLLWRHLGKKQVVSRVE